MSAYATVKTTFRDRDALVQALRDAGYASVEVHAEAATLQGYRGDRSRQAHVVVRKGTHTDTRWEDVGFERGNDGSYVAHLSTHMPAARIGAIKRAYACNVLRAEAKRNGWQVAQETLADGRVKLTVRR